MTEVIYDDDESVDTIKAPVPNNEIWGAGSKKPDKVSVSFSKKWAIITSIIVILIVAAGACWYLGYFKTLYRWYSAATLTVRVVEKDTNKPLANVMITVADKNATTDSTGTVNLQKLPNGKQNITFNLDGYDPKTIEAQLYRGDNPLPDVVLEKTPEKVYSLSGTVTDIISAAAVPKVKVVVSDKSAVTDDKGYYQLSVRADVTKVTFSIDGYQQFQSTLALKNDKFDAVNAQLSPIRNVVFELEQSGKTDLYSTDFLAAKSTRLSDGKQGYSNKNPIVAPDEQRILFLSNRDGAKDASGAVGYRAYLRDAKGTVVATTTDLNPHSIHWLDAKRFVYVYNEVGSYTRDHLVVYNTDTKKRTVVGEILARNDINTANGLIAVSKSGTYIAYYSSATAVSADNTDAVTAAASYNGMYTVKSDGSSWKKLGDQANSPDFIYFPNSDAELRLNYFVNGVLSTKTANPSTGAMTDLSGKSVWERDYATKNSANLDTNVYQAVNTIQTKSGQFIYIDTKNSQTDVFTVDSAGNNEKQLTRIGTVKNISLSADEKYLLVGTKDNNNASALYVVGSSGGTAKKLADINGLAFGFAP